jgi:hypothetical protein
MTLGYIAFVIYIFVEINLNQNKACGIPPIKGCIEHDAIRYTPMPHEPVVTFF